jgi:hypothetical protein
LQTERRRSNYKLLPKKKDANNSYSAFKDCSNGLVNQSVVSPKKYWACYMLHFTCRYTQSIIAPNIVVALIILSGKKYGHFIIWWLSPISFT